MKEMREIDKALQAYEERFGERFPTEAMGLASAEEVLAEIQRCLEAGEAARLDYDPTADY